MARHRLRRPAGRPAALRVLLRSLAMLAAVGVIAFVILSNGRPDGTPSLEHTPNPPASAGQVTTAVVTTDALNVRDGASLDAAVIDTLSQGARLEVLGEPRNGFTPIRHASGQAWMASEFLMVDGFADVAASRAGQDVAPESMVAGVSEEPLQSNVPLDDGRITDIPAEEEVLQEHWIDVNRTTGAVTLHEGASVVTTYTAKTGRDTSADGFFSTALGTFHVFSMSKELAETPFAEGVYLTDWVGFDSERSNGFHSPARDASGNLQPAQTPATLGCVRLEADDAEAVFDFSFIGMRVEVHD